MLKISYPIHQIPANTDFDKDNFFNEYFHSVFYDPSVVSNVDELPDIPRSLHVIDITISDVYEALVSLDVDTSLGKDEISPRVLQSHSVFHFTIYLLSLKICFDTFQVEGSLDYSSI